MVGTTQHELPVERNPFFNRSTSVYVFISGVNFSSVEIFLLVFDFSGVILIQVFCFFSLPVYFALLSYSIDANFQPLDKASPFPAKQAGL